MTTDDKLHIIKEVVEESYGVDTIRHEPMVRISSTYTDAKITYGSIAKRLVYQASLTNIGRIINRNHATVIYYVRRAEELKELEKGFLNLYNECLIKCQDRLESPEIINCEDLEEAMQRYQYHKTKAEIYFNQMKYLLGK